MTSDSTSSAPRSGASASAGWESLRRWATTAPLPLLTKELAEQSSRHRTFVFRTIFAVGLYAAALGVTFNQFIWSEPTGLELLGTGDRIFTSVVNMLVVGVYLMMPLLTAGCLTIEKERNTLPLLLITKMRPWEVIVQKCLSRVIPMLLYLLMALPLLAVAYSLGGVTLGRLMAAAAALLWFTVRLGAVAVLASTLARTTTQAFLLTYVLDLLLMGLLWLVNSPLIESVAPLNWNPQVLPQGVSFRSASGLLTPQEAAGLQQWKIAAAFFSPSFARLMASDREAIAVNQLLLRTIGETVGLWWIATQLLWSRAFLTPTDWWMKLLRAIDEFFKELNNNPLTRGIELVKDHSQLPGDKPIAWRECSRRTFGATRYLFRILVAIEVPLLFFLVVRSDRAAYDLSSQRLLTVLGWLVIGVGGLMMLCAPAAAMTGERARRSWEVLLSTPLSSREIVSQKLAGIWRLWGVLWIPLLTILGWRLTSLYELGVNDASTLTLLTAGLLWWPILAWIGLHAGLRFRTLVAAILMSLLAVAGLALGLHVLAVCGSLVFGGISGELHEYPGNAVATLVYCGVSPWGFASELNLVLGIGTLRPSEVRGGAVLVQVCLAAGLLWLLWRLAPAHLIRTTGRCEANKVLEPLIPRSREPWQPPSATTASEAV